MPSSSYGNASDQRQSERPRRQSRVVELRNDQVDAIRQRELASFYAQPEKSLVLRQSSVQEVDYSSSRDDVGDSRQLVRSQRAADDTNIAASSARRWSQDGRRSRRDESYDNDSDDRRRKDRRRRGRAQSEQPRREQADDQQQLRQVQTQEQSYAEWRKNKTPLNKHKLSAGQLASAYRNKDNGNFVERNFDSSWDGLLAASAGAAIGAITVRRLQDPEATEELNQMKSRKNRMKLVGGAVAGAALFNMGETWFRVFTEEHAEGSEALGTFGELCCEGLDNFPIA